MAASRSVKAARSDQGAAAGRKVSPAMSASRRKTLWIAGGIAAAFGGLSILRMARSTPDAKEQQDAQRQISQRKPLTEQDLREGGNYRELASPVAVATAAGKVEVLEFFWYGCPHCYALEPYLPVWLATLPKAVQFRHVPVGFGAAHRAHQRLFYALQAMGKEHELRPKVFEAIHVQKRSLLTDEDMGAFVTSHGVSAEQWNKAFGSTEVEQLARQAKSLGDAYSLDGVPAFAVGGRYYVSSERAGDSLRALEVTGLLAKRIAAPG